MHFILGKERSYLCFKKKFQNPMCGWPLFLAEETEDWRFEATGPVSHTLSEGEPRPPESQSNLLVSTP